LPEKNDTVPRFHLFVRPKDEKAELWEGARSGIQAALDIFNADEVTSRSVYKSCPLTADTSGRLMTLAKSTNSCLIFWLEKIMFTQIYQRVSKPKLNFLSILAVHQQNR